MKVIEKLRDIQTEMIEKIINIDYMGKINENMMYYIMMLVFLVLIAFLKRLFIKLLNDKLKERPGDKAFIEQSKVLMTCILSIIQLVIVVMALVILFV